MDENEFLQKLFACRRERRLNRPLCHSKRQVVNLNAIVQMAPLSWPVFIAD